MILTSLDIYYNAFFSMYVCMYTGKAITPTEGPLMSTTLWTTDRVIALDYSK